MKKINYKIVLIESFYWCTVTARYTFYNKNRKINWSKFHFNTRLAWKFSVKYKMSVLNEAKITVNDNCYRSLTFWSHCENSINISIPLSYLKIRIFPSTQCILQFLTNFHGFIANHNKPRLCFLGIKRLSCRLNSSCVSCCIIYIYIYLPKLSSLSSESELSIAISELVNEHFEQFP